ncbi:MAG: alpha/beta hydrolase [Woeseiaceae bacterium]|nr:alpha/beta hydrolase [Woeseiaceae bacterium]
MIRVATTLSLLLCILAAGGCATQSAEDMPRQVLVPLVYVTDRSLDDDSRPKRYYGGDRGELQTGMATIAIATRRDHATPFADWQRWKPRLDGSRKRDELLSVMPARGTDLDRIVAEYASLSGTRSALLYVHGFRRRFDTSAVNLAKLVYQVSPDAVPILYSWPSTGNVFKYKGDVRNLEWSGGTLESLLAQLMDAPEIETIHVIAHSLGSFALLEAIASIAERAPEAVRTSFGQVLLVSPDIARPRFEQVYLPVIRASGLNVTIYAAENDVPLQTSRRVNKAERVGDAKRQVPLYPGTETVLVSDVVSILNSHDAHLRVVEVQTDIGYLIRDGLAADRRPTLERIEADGGVYWRVKSGQP